MLSFEEFQAIQNREVRQREAGKAPAAGPTDKAKAKAKPPTKPNTEAPNLSSTEETAPAASAPQAKQVSWRRSLGQFLELNQIQGFYLALLLLDTFSAFSEVSLAKANMATPTALRLASACQAFSIFCNFFFAIEILLSYFAFGLALLGHWGYMVDTLVVSCQLSWKYSGIGGETRILSIVRIWRLFRLVNALVAAEREAHEQTMQQLQLRSTEVAELELKIADHTLELEKEKEARKAVEGMLVNYKEEVDTLNEALKIAAMDIAEVGQEDDDLMSLGSEEAEGGEKPGDEGSRGGGSVSSARKTLSNIIQSTSSVTGTSAAEDKARLIVVKEDGSFMTA